MPPRVRARDGLIAAALVAALVATHGSALQRVERSRSGRDFATYYYAAQAALDGRDPYDRRELGALARQDRTRRSVHPYFYPPPFLLGMVWVAPLSLKAATLTWFFLQELALVGSLVALRRWLRAPWWLLGAVAALYGPLPDNLTMGQVNLTVGLLAIVGLWRGSGTVVGAAAMAKMSPALYLAGWGARGRLRPVVFAGLTAIALSLVSLPVVDLPTQLRFYTEVLPGFSSGAYNGLTVPITLPANHSIPDLANQVWPGPDDHTLSATAATVSRAASLTLLAGLSLVARRARGALATANAFGALTVLLVATPVYTYEHHLAMLLLPLVAAGAAVARGHLARGWWAAWLPAAIVLGLPLQALREAKQAAPAAEWWVQESKFFALALLAVVCVAAALTRGRAPADQP